MYYIFNLRDTTFKLSGIYYAKDFTLFVLDYVNLLVKIIQCYMLTHIWKIMGALVLIKIASEK